MSLYDFIGQPDPNAEDDQLAADLAAIYGLDQPQSQAPAKTFHPTGYESFLEALAGGLQGVQAPRPRNFWEGLAVGGAQGLGAAGTRVAKARAKFEAQQAERAKSKDAERLAASRAYRTSLAGAAIGSAKEMAAEARKTSEYERDNPIVTPELKAQLPALKDFPEGVRIGKEVFQEAQKRTLPETKKEKDKERLVQIEGPNGPVYVRESDALGKRPPKPSGAQAGKIPSASERKELAADATAIEQSNRIKALFKPEYVGPYSGMLGGVATRFGGPLGAMRRGFVGPGESDFKSSLAIYRNAVINALSGAAVSESEAKRMKEQIPQESDPSEVFAAKMRQTDVNLRTVARRRRQTFTETGLDLSGLSPLPPSPGRVIRGRDGRLVRIE